VDFSTLKMEAIRSSETSIDARSTQRHIPEDDILYKVKFQQISDIPVELHLSLFVEVED
jgi:hypothetical protein